MKKLFILFSTSCSCVLVCVCMFCELFYSLFILSQPVSRSFFLFHFMNTSDEQWFNDLCFFLTAAPFCLLFFVCRQQVNKFSFCFQYFLSAALLFIYIFLFICYGLREIVLWLIFSTSYIKFMPFTTQQNTC